MHFHCSRSSPFKARAIAIAADYRGRVVTVAPLDVTARKNYFCIFQYVRFMIFSSAVAILFSGTFDGVCVRCCGVQRGNKRVKLNVHSN